MPWQLTMVMTTTHTRTRNECCLILDLIQVQITPLFSDKSWIFLPLLIQFPCFYLDPNCVEKLIFKLSSRFSILWSLNKICAVPVSPSILLLAVGIWVEKQPLQPRKGVLAWARSPAQGGRPIWWHQLHIQGTPSSEPDCLTWDPAPLLTGCVAVNNLLNLSASVPSSI